MTKTIYFGIYEIKNLLNGKSYIGQSATNVHSRCNRHITAVVRGCDNQHLVRAVNKYGIANFSFKVILYCEEFELLRYEDALIKVDRPNRYNIRDAADSNKGCKHSEETKHILSELHKGMIASDETRCNVSKAMLGNQHLKGYRFTEESKRKVSKALLGNQYVKGHKVSEETRHKMSESHKGHLHSDESKRKISEAHKRRRHMDDV
jgi:hypothetical protein